MFEEIKSILIEELSIENDAIKPEAELNGDLGINSLELADLALICEDRFGISVNDDDVRGFITVADVVNYVENNKN